MPNPFAPLATGPQANWTAKEHQNAANFAFYELQGADEGVSIAFFRAMHNEHARKAAAKRADGRAPTRIPNRMDLPL